MKALKEKRIGLRSLLRRGLVILSLFALVFALASCADSDEGGGEGPTTATPAPAPKYKPASIEIKSWPTNDSYEGLPLSLEGLEVRVYYDGGPENNKTISPKNATFSTYPAYAVGVVIDDSGTLKWVPQLQYTLLWYSSEANDVFTAVLDLQDANSPAVKAFTAATAAGDTVLAAKLQKEIPTVVPIARADAWTDVENAYETDSGYIYTDADTEFKWSKGLRLYGDLEQKIYVDDYPTWSKYKMQAEYVNAKVKEVNLVSTTEWKIVPLYQYAAEDTAQYYPIGATGDLFVTVARNKLGVEHPYVIDAVEKANLDPDDLDPDAYDPALTIRHPYEEIYIVKKIDVTTAAALDDLYPFFYWMDDSSEAWFDRLVGSQAEITVTYTGNNRGPKTFTPNAMKELNDIWLNTIFDPSDTSPTNTVPFAVKGIRATDPAHRAMGNNRDPKIEISYRGAYAQIQTPVYTRLSNFTVEALDPNSLVNGGVPADMRPKDNDVGAMNALTFDRLLKATATYTAYFNSDLSKPWTVTFAPDGIVRNQDVTAAEYRVVNGKKTMLAGVTLYGSDGDIDNPDYYSNNFVDVSISTRNNGRETAVVFAYASPARNDGTSFTVDSKSTTYQDAINVGTRRMTFRLPVHWENIVEPTETNP